MKTSKQIDRIVEQCAKSGTKHITSYDKYGRFSLYAVVANGVERPRLSWLHSFDSLGEFAEFLVKNNLQDSTIFIPYI